MKITTNRYKSYTVSKRIADLIDIIQEDFPKAFPKKPDKKVPLKIGIFIDLMTWNKDRYSMSEIRSALSAWCQGRRYNEALSSENAVRVDLYGNQVERVSVKDAAIAKKQLESTHNKRKNKNIN